jgi:hypothetical protein
LPQTLLPKLLLGATLVLASGAPVHASEWLTCSNADEAVELSLLLGADFALGPVAARLHTPSQSLVTDAAYGEGGLMAIAQSYFGPDLIQVDLRDANLNEPLARVRLLQAEADGQVVRVGTVELFGAGVWPVICDPT